jgi:transcriptional antiterminator
MERRFAIIKILLESKEPLTINNIANQLSVSNKTIRNDLKKVKEYVDEKELYLNKKPGIGISIEGSDINKLNLASEIKITKKIIEPYSPEARKYYILKRLFMSGENITIKELAEELYVSRVTVHKDLAEVEKWLKKYNLQLFKKTNYGIEVIGKEKSWRNAAASLITLKKGNKELKELLFDDYKGKVDYATITKLKDLIDLDYKKLEKIINDAESKLKFRFSNESFVSLVIHVAISIKRLEQNKDVSLPENILQNLKQKDEYLIAEGIAKDVEKAFHVEMPQSEIGYIALHILGGKLQQNEIDALEFDFIDEANENIPIIMAKEIINVASKALSMNLASDKQLLNGLVLHLIPTVKRLKYGLTLRNPMLDEIKSNYPEILGAAWMTSIVFKKYIGKKITEEEIGYIAMHIGAAVERQKKPLRVLVVCTSGIGTSQLLAARLERHFRELNIKNILSYISINKELLNDIDFIISTVPIEVKDKPVININPLLNQNDIKKLDIFIQSINNKKQNKTIKKNNMINEDFIEKDMEFQSKQEAIKYMCSLLYSRGYIKENFEEDVLNREKIASTEIGRGVAVPHGSRIYVNRSQIFCMKLKKPIKWNQENVDIIFLLCIAEADISLSCSLIRELYKKIDCTNVLSLIRNAKSKIDIKNIMEGNYNVDK